MLGPTFTRKLVTLVEGAVSHGHAKRSNNSAVLQPVSVAESESVPQLISWLVYIWIVPSCGEQRNIKSTTSKRQKWNETCTNYEHVYSIILVKWIVHVDLFYLTINKKECVKTIKSA